jgi:integrase/recombinase XerD
MNHRTSGFLLSKAIIGFLQFKAAEALSPNTLDMYERDLRRWLAYCGDRDLAGLSGEDVRAFMAWLRTDYKPHRFSSNDKPLSPKTLRNFWITLCSFFRWAQTDLGLPNLMKGIPAPRFQRAPVEVFTKSDIERLIKLAEFMQEAKTDERRTFVMRRPTAKRDRAIILVLLDTGLRANELCSLNVEDVDMKTGRVQVKHGADGGAKGGKGRTTYLGKVARRALWLYLTSREDGDDRSTPLFMDKFERPMSKSALLQMIKGLGEKAHIKKCHPHVFRHTFAITYLRSGGDVFTLQALLGHGSLDMVKHYARIAEIDVEQVHRRASPADNWRL